MEKQLSELIKKNLPLHAVIEDQVRITPFGEITFNLEIIEGRANIASFNIVKRKRKRYIDKSK